MTYKIASKKDRLFAYLIDSFFQVILFIPLTFLINKIFNDKYSLENINSFVFFFTYIGNRIIYASLNNGNSIGKLVMNLEVINIDEKKVGFLVVLLKESIFSILNFIDIIWLFFGKQNQTGHDRLLDLLVIKKEFRKEDYDGYIQKK